MVLIYWAEAQRARVGAQARQVLGPPLDDWIHYSHSTVTRYQLATDIIDFSTRITRRFLDEIN